MRILSIFSLFFFCLNILFSQSNPEKALQKNISDSPIIINGVNQETKKFTYEGVEYYSTKVKIYSSLKGDFGKKNTFVDVIIPVFKPNGELTFFAPITDYWMCKKTDIINPHKSLHANNENQSLELFTGDEASIIFLKYEVKNDSKKLTYQNTDGVLFENYSELISFFESNTSIIDQKPKKKDQLHQ